MTRQAYGHFGLTERSELDWQEYLRDFLVDVYPLFEAHGIALGEALLLWKLNAVNNSIEGLQQTIEDLDLL